MLLPLLNVQICVASVKTSEIVDNLTGCLLLQCSLGWLIYWERFVKFTRDNNEKCRQKLLLWKELNEKFQ